MAWNGPTWTLARAEPARLEQTGGLVVTVANVAIALGAIVGGVLVDNHGRRAPVGGRRQRRPEHRVEAYETNRSPTS